MKKKEEKISTIENIEVLFKAPNKVNKLFDYSTITSEDRYKTNHGGGIKILNSKQIVQRWPIALAQTKVGNTSKSLLNEICQIIYYLYQ